MKEHDKDQQSESPLVKQAEILKRIGGLVEHIQRLLGQAERELSLQLTNQQYGSQPPAQCNCCHSGDNKLKDNN